MCLIKRTMVAIFFFCMASLLSSVNYFRSIYKKYRHKTGESYLEGEYGE